MKTERQLNKWRKKFLDVDEVFAIAWCDEDRGGDIIGWIHATKFDVLSNKSVHEDETLRRLFTDSRKAQAFMNKMDHKDAARYGYKFSMVTLNPPRKGKAVETLPLPLLTPPAGNGYVILLPQKKDRAPRYWGQKIRNTYRTFPDMKQARVMKKRLEDAVYTRGSLTVVLSPLSSAQYVGDLKDPPFDNELKPPGHGDWNPIVPHATRSHCNCNSCLAGRALLADPSLLAESIVADVAEEHLLGDN